MSEFSDLLARPQPRPVYFYLIHLCYLPNFEEIVKHEAAMPVREAGLEPEHHEAFDSPAVLTFDKNTNKWHHDANFETNFDDNAALNWPMVYLSHHSPVWLGETHLTGRTVSPHSWMGDDQEFVEWPPIVVQATETFFQNLANTGFRGLPEHAVEMSYLCRLRWHPSVDRESGIDEGGFEVDEIISAI